ncbi:MAG TPA: type II toxin-antitoxin system VapC family toxin [Candidatus Polarisedimenticolia bacterium]|nr:type II toxin-antitoxin system VapC family toxin [Candidatus Polarisedimenticolia bacterium]
MRFLLDSTVLIDHANRDVEAMRLVRSLIEEGHDLFTCDVVTCEALSKGDAGDVRYVEALLDALEYVSTTPQAARHAGKARRERHAAGGKRALGDALIAGIAAELEAIVVTRNRRDFARQGIETLEY